MRHAIGVDQIAWGSDYPHPEGTWPHTAEHMRDTFRQLPENELTQMIGGNAANWYGFDQEKLAPIVDRIGPKKSDFT